jgi:hypothetical protein
MGFTSSAKSEIQLLPNPGLPPTVIPSDIFFLTEFLGQAFCAGIAVEVLQLCPANCLYGGRNRLRVAV